ncbi:MAG: LysR family transcriptional regulator [Desulfobacteraceae bacterium]|nr:LysR family transcriptional regulator [Desulfobacteraceae bacterium]MBU4002539.1 LysR family transcriptional regulator [Pseudomonadota bacterium]MBU4054720.1 LysR family transcriptional regulator [Pseudomonadota bacterium]
MIISMEQLAAFKALAETESFSRAAEKLFRTQPAISQAIRSLETELGQSLFTREGRKSSLTQAGQIFLVHVHDVFETLEQGKLRIDALKDLKEGKLTLSTSDTTAYYLLPEVLKAFRDQYPGVDVRIHCKPSPVSAEQVLSREADLGIVTLPVDHPKLVAEPLMLREDVVICSFTHALAGRKKIGFKDLEACPLLLLDRGSNTRTYIDQRLARAGFNPKITMELGSIEVIKRLVQLGFGLSIVPLISVQREIEEGTLKALDLFKKSDCRTLGVIYPKSGIHSLPARMFAGMLRDFLKPSG